MVKCSLISSPYQHFNSVISQFRENCPKIGSNCQISSQKLSNIHKSQSQYRSLDMSLCLRDSILKIWYQKKISVSVSVDLVSEKSQGIGIGSSGLKEKCLYRIDIEIFSLAIYWSIGNWQNRQRIKDQSSSPLQIKIKGSLILDSE